MGMTLITKAVVQAVTEMRMVRNGSIRLFG